MPELAYFVDSLRVLTIALSVTLIVACIGIAYSYARRFRSLTTPKDRLLPAHVVKISISYALLSAAAAIETWHVIGMHITWRLAFYPLSLALGLWAMMDVTHHLQRRPPKIDLTHEIVQSQQDSGQHRRRIDRIMDEPVDAPET